LATPVVMIPHFIRDNKFYDSLHKIKATPNLQFSDFVLTYQGRRSMTKFDFHRKEFDFSPNINLKLISITWKGMK
jgi:hypothetical protein